MCRTQREMLGCSPEARASINVVVYLLCASDPQAVLLCASVCQALELAEERSEPSLVLRVPICGTGKERNLIPGVWDSPLTSTPHSSSVP